MNLHDPNAHAESREGKTELIQRLRRMCMKALILFPGCRVNWECFRHSSGIKMSRTNRCAFPVLGCGEGNATGSCPESSSSLAVTISVI